MAKYKQADLKAVKTVSLKTRKSKVRVKDIAIVFDPRKQTFSEFVGSLPGFLSVNDLNTVVEDIVKAFKAGRPVIVMMGAHVIKVGLSPLIVDLVRKKVFTGIAMNSAAAIHDVELTKWGITSEDVEKNISDGRFGMSKETGEFINNTLLEAMNKDSMGYGEALGMALQNSANKNISILANCYSMNVPVTVHAAIGTDIIHQQPSMDGGVTGEMSYRDFKVFCEVVKGLKGGVVLNFGSAVILPEVFLKALTVARNLQKGVKGFTTANFDMIQHYRPRLNVVQRPTKDGGRGFLFTGHHEIMIPLLCAMIKNKLNNR